MAPPSTVRRGQYQIIEGTLADLSRLPVLQNKPNHGATGGTPIGQGSRNVTLWRRCMLEARYCDDFDALLDIARTENGAFEPALPEEEVLKTARSAWGYTERGENRIGRRAVVATYDEIDELLHEYPDAFILLTFLRRNNWGDNFLVANGLADRMPNGGWPRKRLAAARSKLVESGMISLVRPASGLRGPALYRFKGGQK